MLGNQVLLLVQSSLAACNPHVPLPVIVCPRRLRGGGGEQRGEQQDECRPRRAEEMIGSVHCLMIFYVNINVLSDIICIFAA